MIFNREYNMDFGSLAIKKLIKTYDFNTVLDIGAGRGDHSLVFAKKGKSVTAVDIKCDLDEHEGIKFIEGDFNVLKIEDKFDCIWASHILEHQLNANIFLKKIYSLLKEDGIFAVTVPPLKQEIVGGHVNLYNGGLLLYQLVLAGFDCSEAKLKKYGYNISVIVRKKSISIPELSYDNGDIEQISQFMPGDLHESFDGDIDEINW